MLDDRETRRGLYELAAVFKVHMRAKRYSQARACYDRAREIVVSNNMSEELKDELFGVRGERGVIIREGMFQEAMVQKAYEETCVRTHNIPQIAGG